MNKISKIGGLLLASFTLLGQSCTKEPEIGILDTGNYTETSTALKDATDVSIGVAIDHTPMLNDQKYAGVVKRDFDGVTFGYQMKHGAIVQNNGTMDFTKADALVSAVSGMQIFGHTLGWHANQNATYLKTYAGIIAPSATEMLANPGFETGMTGWNQVNTGSPAGSSSFALTTVSAEVHAGTNALKVVTDKDYTGQQWRVQLASDALPMENGKSYVATFWIRAANAGGSMRMSLNPDNSANPSSYQGDQTIGTTWSQISFNFTKTATVATKIVFDMGQKANTYYIDDVSVKEVVPVPSGAQIATKVDQALNNFVTGMVNHYKGTVKAWDVVNEVVSPSGAIRTSANSADVSDKNAGDIFFWGDYLGRDFALKAFNYAKAADPTADLYINEYNLEGSPAKLDSLIKYVAELKAKGAKIDGIGTQMHIGRTNINYAGIDAMMKKLAATGLKIRISELDVKAVQGSSAGKLTPELAANQAQIYEYVVKSYFKHIPAAQRTGITVWGVNDKTSWLYNNGTEHPLLYDNDFNKKPAYAGFLQGLKAL